MVHGNGGARARWMPGGATHPGSMVGLVLGAACVDLTAPPEVVKYRNGEISGTGGDVGATGGVGEGGSANSGGSLGSGGGVIGGSTGAGGVSGGGGAGGVGGSSAQADASVVVGLDADDISDVALGTGGSAGTGGGLAQDGATSTGGAAGTGGKKVDASAGTGGASPDAPGTGGVIGTGGKAGTGGVIGTGGVVGTGGTVMGTGGRIGSGGVAGTGGATATGGSTGYNCASAIVPASGVVTDFTDWNATTARWGTGALIGTIYQYAGSSSTMNTAKVEGTPKGLHLTGTVPASGYGGGGLTFLSCVSVASFTKVQFDVYGSAANCAIELQLQTFDQRPNDQSPPGGCVKASDGSGCFAFPVMKQVVDLSTAVASPGKTVTTTLSSFSNWSAAAAGQIVGLQWQFTHGSGGDCAVGTTFTNIKFVP